MSRRPRIALGAAMQRTIEPYEIVRFLSFVEVDENGCWIWKGCKDRNGWGKFWFRGEARPASRVSYVMFRGPLRDGNDVHHTQACKSRCCVNPMHLAQRSREWNSRDGGRRRQAMTCAAAAVPEPAADDIPF